MSDVAPSKEWISKNVLWFYELDDENQSIVGINIILHVKHLLILT